MYSIVSTAILQGIRSVSIQVEADVSDGMPLFEMVGFLASEVQESKERVRTALRNSGFVLPPKRITVNFTPADIRKSGSGFDLPIAVAVLAALGVVKKERLSGILFLGEVGLNGRLKPVKGVLPVTAEAKERGIGKCIIPMENMQEAKLVPGIEIGAADCIRTVVRMLNAELKWTEPLGCNPAYTPYNIEEKDIRETALPDFSEIRGQKLLKRACEAAVSGMHNLLMIGPPGSGKTMMAACLPTILPPMDAKEQMELSKIYSVCGLLCERKALISERPFRAPHHTITVQGLAGGGGYPKPGEISMAHKGVLFLDELAEFRKNTLEVLRQPLEERKIRLVRLNGTYEYPADFILAAAMNPCSCGYYPDMQKCRCSQASINRYLGKISQPLIDRLDICVEAPRIGFDDLNGTERAETSEIVRKRVEVVYEIQKERYQKEEFRFNSRIPAGRIREFCGLCRKQEADMEQVYRRLNLTARSYHKILKTARTLADMEQSKRILDRHLDEAVCYRSLDKKFWEGPI